LSQIEKESLAQGGINPKRRDGSLYPLFAPVAMMGLTEPLNRRDGNTMTKKRRMSNEGTDHVKVKKKKNSLEQDSDSVENFENDESFHSDNIESLPRTSQSRSERYAAYMDFKKKYRSLYHLDYGDTGIHAFVGISSMWAQHKRLFNKNAVCDDNCRCIDKLPMLTLHVVRDHEEKQAKKGSPVGNSNAIFPRGVFDYFAPRFVPLLKEEYPSETAAQTIQRLVAMWPFHQSSRLFGINCSKNCDCVLDWDQLFGKGDNEKAEEFLLASRRRLTGKKLDAGATHTSRSPLEPGKSSQAAIPRKNKTVVRTSLVRSASICNEPDIATPHMKRPLPDQSDEGRIAKKRRCLQSSSHKIETYIVTFDPSYPLGGYFRTETGQNGMLKCRLYSKFDNGQLSKDSRITSGTNVASVLIGETRHDIAGHLDLKRFYDDAHGCKNRLCLIFENQGVKPGWPCDNDWNVNGNWVGSVHDGWPGGARVVQKYQNQASLPLETAVESCEPVRSVGRNGTIQIHAPAAEVHEWTTTTSVTEPGHNCSVAGKSSLRRNEAAETSKKKVTFSSERPDEYLFKEDAPVNQRVFKVDKAAVGSGLQPPLSPTSALIDALRSKPCKELIKVVDNGVCEDREVVDTILDSQYRCVTDALSNAILKAATSQMIDSDCSENSRIDLKAKQNVLSICINGAHAVQQAMTLKNWFTLEIHLNHIEVKKIEGCGVAFGTQSVLGGAVEVRSSKGEIEKLVRKVVV
jgi:hypothetical protein